jgi:hypothetical protein
MYGAVSDTPAQRRHLELAVVAMIHGDVACADRGDSLGSSL